MNHQETGIILVNIVPKTVQNGPKVVGTVWNGLGAAEIVRNGPKAVKIVRNGPKVEEIAQEVWNGQSVRKAMIKIALLQARIRYLIYLLLSPPQHHQQNMTLD